MRNLTRGLAAALALAATAAGAPTPSGCLPPNGEQRHSRLGHRDA